MIDLTDTVTKTTHRKNNDAHTYLKTSNKIFESSMCYIQHIVKKKLPYLQVDQKTGNVIDNDETENAIEDFIYQAIGGLDMCKRACQKVIKQQVRFNCNGNNHNHNQSSFAAQNATCTTDNSILSPAELHIRQSYITTAKKFMCLIHKVQSVLHKILWQRSSWQIKAAANMSDQNQFYSLGTKNSGNINLTGKDNNKSTSNDTDMMSDGDEDGISGGYEYIADPSWRKFEVEKDTLQKSLRETILSEEKGSSNNANLARNMLNFIDNAMTYVNQSRLAEKMIQNWETALSIDGQIKDNISNHSSFSSLRGGHNSMCERVNVNKITTKIKQEVTDSPAKNKNLNNSNQVKNFSNSTNNNSNSIQLLDPITPKLEDLILAMQKFSHDLKHELFRIKHYIKLNFPSRGGSSSQPIAKKQKTEISTIQVNA